MHDFNLWGAFYLAKADEEGESMWFKTRQILEKRGYKDDDWDGPDPWLTGTRQYFDVDVEKHRIYKVDSVEDLISFFRVYGHYDQLVCPKEYHAAWAYYYDKYGKKAKDTTEIFKLAEAAKKQDRLRIKRHRLLKIINAFLEENHTPVIYSSHFAAVKQHRTTRNMPLVKFFNGQIVRPQKITFRFLVDLVRTKEAYEAFVGDLNTEEIETTLISINYPLLKKHGYNGVYYSTNIIRFADTVNTDEKYKNIIAPPDLTSFLDPIGYTSQKDLECIASNIRSYIQWLWSDTLILWNWVF